MVSCQFLLQNIVCNCVVCLTYIYRSKLYSHQQNHRYKCIKALGGRLVDGFDGIAKNFAWVMGWWNIWWLYGALNKEEWWMAMICSNEWLYNRLHFCVVMSSNDICKDYWGSHLSITDKQRRRKLCLNFAFAWNIEKEWDTQQSTIEGKRATTHATKHNYKWCLRNHSLYCTRLLGDRIATIGSNNMLDLDNKDGRWHASYLFQTRLIVQTRPNAA